MTGSSRATRPASRWCSTATAALASAMQTGGRGRVLVGEATLPDGRRAVPVFQLLAERYLDPNTRPRRSRPSLRHPGRHASAGSPPSSPASPSSRRSRSPQPWTDWAGRRHETMRGRPVVDARDARHLGAFQRLPDLPRAASAADPARHDRCAGRLPLQVAVSEAGPAGPKPAGKPGAGRRRQAAAPARRSAFRAARRTCWSTTTARPLRIDKAFSWDAPLAAHGMMHMVIAQRLGTAIPTRSTRCSCSWPTWPGTRR